MMEVRSGVLLGSMGDALAVFSRVPSITKRYRVTHVLTLSNKPPEWHHLEEQEDEGDTATTGVRTEPPDDQEPSDSATAPVGDVGGASVKGEGGSGEGGDGGRGQDAPPERSKRKQERMQTMFVQVADIPSSDLLHHFEPCCQFIKQAIQHGTVLVHCEYGISRSVTVVLAYLMWSEGLPYSVVYKELKERKPAISPNSGFVGQLKLWGAMRCRIDSGNKTYKAYRLKHLAKQMKDTGYIESIELSPDPFASELESSAYFKCRKCRRLLFTDESVLRHQVGKGQAAFKWHKRSSHTTNSSLVEEKQEETPEDTLIQEEPSPPTDQAEEAAPASPSWATELAEVRAKVATVVSLGEHSSSSSTASSTCSSHFIDPVEWMGSLILGSVEGKILCPKCSAKVGSFNWSGEQCSCGQWVTPSFQIHKNKLDETRTLVRRKNATKST